MRKELEISHQNDMDEFKRQSEERFETLRQALYKELQISIRGAILLSALFCCTFSMIFASACSWRMRGKVAVRAIQSSKVGIELTHETALEKLSKEYAAEVKEDTLVKTPPVPRVSDTPS